MTTRSSSLAVPSTRLFESVTPCDGRREERTPSVHELLRHLEVVGFSGAPRVLGSMLEGEEVLTFHRRSAGQSAVAAGVADGRRPGRDRSAPARVSRCRRKFVPSPTAVGVPVSPSSRPVRSSATAISDHGTPSGEASIWSSMIDWEFVEPRWPIEDVAEVAWYFVPLQGQRVWREAGFAAPPRFGRRLAVLCRATGTSASSKWSTRCWRDSSSSGNEPSISLARGCHHGRFLCVVTSTSSTKNTPGSHGYDRSSSPVVTCRDGGCVDRDSGCASRRHAARSWWRSTASRPRARASCTTSRSCASTAAGSTGPRPSCAGAIRSAGVLRAGQWVPYGVCGGGSVRGDAAGVGRVRPAAASSRL